MLVNDAYDRGAKEIGKYKYGKPISQYMKDKRGSNVKRITGITGVRLRVAGDGKMSSAVEIRPAVMPRRTAVMPRGKIDPSKLKHGNGLRMSGGNCEMCGGSMNEKFIFSDASL